MTLVDLPEEDSPDMTLDELAGATLAETPEVIASALLETSCPTCQGKVTVTKHVLRRRAPNLYARVLFVCQDGHQGSATFRALFLGGT